MKNCRKGEFQIWQVGLTVFVSLLPGLNVLCPICISRKGNSCHRSHGLQRQIWSSEKPVYANIPPNRVHLTLCTANKSRSSELSLSESTAVSPRRGSVTNFVNSKRVARSCRIPHSGESNTELEYVVSIYLLICRLIDDLPGAR